MNRMNFARIGLIVAATVLLAACANVTVLPDEVAPVDDRYGFWSGLWHGFIATFAFIGSLFSDDIAVYAVNNNGGWYDFGFMLGIGAFAGGGGKAAS